MSYVIATRPSTREREIIRAAARRRGVPLSRFMIDAACKAAAQFPRQAASLRIDPDYRMPLEASRNPKDFITRKLKAKGAIHR
jgi:uncharacterized protein (DUF1778 family)